MKLLKRFGVIIPLLAIALAFGVYLTLDVSAKEHKTGTLTACLSNGELSNVAIGDAPSHACPEGAIEVNLNQKGAEGPRGRPWP